MKPDRVVIGTDNVRTAEIMKELYEPFMRKNNRMIVMDIRSAEMTKYAANAMLATRISFMNQVANLCERMGADVAAVREGIGSDSRIGYDFLFPGPGYGGSCFPKDVKALIKTGEEVGYSLRVLKAVEEVNEDQKALMFHKISSFFGKDLKGKKIALWGLSFKPQTDDMREAPSLVLIRKLTGAGATIVAYDPVAMHEAERILDHTISYANDPYEAVKDADALLIVTEWPEFRVPDFNRLQSLLKNPVIFDGRNIFDVQSMKSLGFNYYCVGIKS
jgi:UDPglucose 6-dehydrogenase